MTSSKQSGAASFLSALSRGLKQAEIDWRRRDMKEAHRFNPVGIFVPREPDLTRITAELLSPTGCHGQGAAFLRSFLAETKIVGGDDASEMKTCVNSFTSAIENNQRQIEPSDSRDVRAR
jgi:hypothetical protein